MMRSRILLVEPYEDIRRLIEWKLHHEGYEVESVADGRAAIEAMAREAFGCVIVGSPVVVKEARGDVLFLEYLEKNCPQWRPRIVVITTYIESSQVLAASRRLDAWAVFAKPFSPPELMAVINECMAGRKPARRWYGIPDASLSAIGGE